MMDLAEHTALVLDNDQETRFKKMGQPITFFQDPLEYEIYRSIEMLREKSQTYKGKKC